MWLCICCMLIWLHSLTALEVGIIAAVETFLGTHLLVRVVNIGEVLLKVEVQIAGPAIIPHSTTYTLQGGNALCMCFTYCFLFISFSFVSVLAFHFSLFALAFHFHLCWCAYCSIHSCCFGRKIRLHVNVIIVKKFYHHINKYGELITTLLVLL